MFRIKPVTALSGLVVPSSNIVADNNGDTLLKSDVFGITEKGIENYDISTLLDAPLDVVESFLSDTDEGRETLLSLWPMVAYKANDEKRLVGFAENDSKGRYRLQRFLNDSEYAVGVVLYPVADTRYRKLSDAGYTNSEVISRMVAHRLVPSRLTGEYDKNGKEKRRRAFNPKDMAIKSEEGTFSMKPVRVKGYR